MATTRSLYDIYKSRPDLQREFPNWMGEDRTFGSDVGGGLSANKQWDINTWWNRHGQQEYPDTQLAPQQLTTTETEAPRTLTESPLSQAPKKNSYQIFNSALMDMLKEYQGMGTAPLQQRQLDLSTQQAQKISAESPAGFSPSQQEAMRSGQAEAIQPSIAGAEARQQTFQEQMNSFGNILTATKQYAQSMEDSKVKQQENTRTMIQDAITTYGSQAFTGVDEKALAELEKEAGYPKGYLTRKAVTIKEMEVQQKETTADKLPASYQEWLLAGSPGTYQDWLGKTTGGEISPYQEERMIRNLQSVDDLMGRVSGWTVGAGSLLSKLPSTDARNFENDLNTLKANIAFGELTAMREASKTGGALGQVSERELALLEAALAGLDTGQSKDNFIKNLNRVKDSISRWKEAMSSSGGTTGGTTDLWDFNSVGGDTNKAAIAGTAVGEKGGQCGRFVNKITNLGVGDSYTSKMSKMDKSIKTPQAGMVFVMPYNNTGHTGFIMSIKDGVATVKDSNWSLDEKIKIHTIPVSKMTGFSYINKLA